MSKAEVLAEDIITEIELANMLKVARKITGKDIGIYTKKPKQNKIRFSQFLQRNIDYLREKNYLTTEEKAFLFDMQSYTSINSNALVKNTNKTPMDSLSITDMSNIRGFSRPATSKVVNSLIEKGILAKGSTGKGGERTKNFVIFVNPNIIYVGDKDVVKEHLYLLFKGQMKNNSMLKNLPDRLF